LLNNRHQSWDHSANHNNSTTAIGRIQLFTRLKCKLYTNDEDYYLYILEQTCTSTRTSGPDIETGWTVTMGNKVLPSAVPYSIYSESILDKETQSARQSVLRDTRAEIARILREDIEE
jgi:hypothetical protein